MLGVVARCEHSCAICCVTPPTDASDSPADREVAGLRLPVFDREEEGPRPTGSEEVGGAQTTKKGESSKGMKSAIPFILGEGLPPIPAKVVAKVDMAELLRDNIEADR